MSAEKGFIAAHRIVSQAALAGIQSQQAVDEAKLGTVGQAVQCLAERSVHGWASRKKLLLFERLDHLERRVQARSENRFLQLRIQHPVREIISHPRAVGELQFGGSQRKVVDSEGD